MTPGRWLAFATLVFVAALVFRLVGAPRGATIMVAPATTAATAAGSSPSASAAPAPTSRASASAAPLPQPRTRLGFSAGSPGADPGGDFQGGAPAGHEPAAMRLLYDQFAAWALDRANNDSAVRPLGVDCHQPPCLLVVALTTDQDSRFLDRSEAWLRGNGPAGLSSYPHRLDETETRVWYFFNPHPAGSRAHHGYQEQALARIRAEAALLPDFNPSRDGP